MHLLRFHQFTSLALFFIVVFALSSSHTHATQKIAEETFIISSHGIAMHSEPKYKENFTHFDYTSKDARKGGEIKLYGFGTFDSLNEYILKGNPAEHLNLLYDSLTVQAMDEPSTQYGLVAQTIEYPKDRSWVIFHLRPEARFHDGEKLTAEDVVFSFNLLIEEGSPSYKIFFADVEQAEALSQYSVKFTFKNNTNRGLALSIGQLPIFPKHFWLDKAFNQSSLEEPLGSGPYKIKSVEAGRNIRYERVDDYWAKDLAVNKNMYNFDFISVDYYRDMNIAVEALKAGEFDYRWENSSKFWATAYDVPSVKDGKLILNKLKHKANTGIQAFIFNMRKPIFQDIELRKAISYAFDFEWSNQTLFYNAYDRSYSFFTNSDFAARGLPSTKELALLEPYRDQLTKSIFTEAYTPPISNGDDRNRTNLRKAKNILDAAGYTVRDNQLFDKTDKPIRFEMLLVSPGFERIVNPFIQSLARLGIIVTSRLVDSSQYVNRTRSFDYDMMVKSFRQSESPGNEQRNFWGSESADTVGSQNTIGIKNPVVDALINNIVNAEDREELIYATRALDRVLLHNYYVIPQWFGAYNRLVYWNKFGIPETVPIYDRHYLTGIYTWWYDPIKAAGIDKTDPLDIPKNPRTQ